MFQAVEADSDIELDDFYERPSSLISLRSSILEHQAENGRTYHSMSAGKYSFPNDDLEGDRLDLQHHIWVMCLHGELAISPGHKTAKRVLDMGTGTGVWAMNFAEEYPAAEVIGVDLSPMQPGWTLPNCSFEVDDLERRWTWNQPFDFIHCRSMEGCFSDGPEMIKKIYRALKPGGYLEIGGLELPLGCDDDTVPRDSCIWQWHALLQEAAEKIGRPLEGLGKETEAMREAGLIDITRRDYIWPLNPWPADPHLKELGRWQYSNLEMGLEGLCLGLFTRVFQWPEERTLSLCSRVREDLSNMRIHAYWRVHIVYARKPEDSEDSEDSEGTQESEEFEESEGEAEEET
ncbi:methyltransferase domain-containing protein [Colletotrichum tabaci]|uniref:Methyltransferase domain-containing protein n=1 Tax=Colletotrichum tabaci TaxID=1209068 RepID=A0AAV9TJZ8_9PEZI